MELARKLELGEASTIQNLAQAEGVTDRFISRTIRLASLSPRVLVKLLSEREVPAASSRK